MCNAHNHHPACTCGWGGFGHLGRRTADPGYYRDLLRRPRTYDSYVNPNARCPVCGACVFFFQSEHGGRVFFDDLGPPWPKHPCTSSEPAGRSRPTAAPSGPRAHWSAAGWAPLLDASATSYAPELARLTGLHREQPLTLYVLKRAVPGGADLRDLLEDAYVQARRDTPGRYSISILDGDATVTNFVGFLSEIDARVGVVGEKLGARRVFRRQSR